MATTDADRHRLYQRLEEVLGAEEATVMMEHLPPVGWADVATKQDLDLHAAATKRDLDHLAVSMKKDLDHLAVSMKKDLDHLAVAVKKDLDHLAVSMKKDLDHFADRVRGEMAREQRNLVFSMVTANAAMIGLAFAAASLV